ncbi:MAG TPA: hypothetical protein VL136_10910 [Candidatus Babeliales bacterium]|nr:hypothetical protein [Candidatus Babeliales bacterium]
MQQIIAVQIVDVREKQPQCAKRRKDARALQKLTRNRTAGL